MTFGFWMPRVKVVIVLEYLAPWGCLRLYFRGIIRTVGLLL